MQNPAHAWADDHARQDIGRKWTPIERLAQMMTIMKAANTALVSAFAEDAPRGTRPFRDHRAHRVARRKR
jgi:hypothetical protein